MNVPFLNGLGYSFTFAIYLHRFDFHWSVLDEPVQGAGSVVHALHQPLAHFPEIFLAIFFFGLRKNDTSVNAVKQKHWCTQHKSFFVSWTTKRSSTLLFCQWEDRKVRGHSQGRVFLCCDVLLISGVLLKGTTEGLRGSKLLQKELWEQRKLEKGRKGSH